MQDNNKSNPTLPPLFLVSWSTLCDCPRQRRHRCRHEQQHQRGRPFSQCPVIGRFLSKGTKRLDRGKPLTVSERVQFSSVHPSSSGSKSTWILQERTMTTTTVVTTTTAALVESVAVSRRSRNNCLLLPTRTILDAGLHARKHAHATRPLDFDVLGICTSPLFCYRLCCCSPL